MPKFFAPQLEKLASDIFVAAGAPSDVAEHVAKSLVVSNLMGHDSHGVLRIPSYLEAIDKGTCKPAARPSISKETPTTAIINGNWAFGQISASVGTNLAIEKARKSMVAAVSIVECNHIGRLGEYTEMAAQAGMVGFMCGSTYNGGAVTPFGGVGRVLGTNPISFSAPGAEGKALVADVATSVVAEGKLRVARAKKIPVAPGTILDKDGNPSTDAEDYYAGGVLLPFGGHKGYVLSVLADLMGGYVSAGDSFAGKDISFANLFIVVNVEAFRPLEEYREVATKRLGVIQSVKPAPGFSEVMLPGDPERKMRAQRTAEGVVLPDDTAEQLAKIAAKYDIAMPMPA